MSTHVIGKLSIFRMFQIFFDPQTVISFSSIRNGEVDGNNRKRWIRRYVTEYVDCLVFLDISLRFSLLSPDDFITAE